MSTIFDMSAHTNGSLSISAGNNAVFLSNSLWTMTTSAVILTLNGDNLFRNEGKLYADAIAVRGTANSIRIENLATGVISSSGGAAISLAGTGHNVANAGYIAGDNAIVFEAGGSVFNAGMLISKDITVVFGATSSDQEIVNDGSIVSAESGAISFASSTRNTLFNTGTITVDDVAVEVRGGDGRTVITNSGTINGAYAMFLRGGDDIVVNTGTIAGISALGEGDDLFDSGDGAVNGLVAGEGGDDTLIGGAASDEFSGGFGADLLIGNDGNDVLDGGPGGDELDGGAGRDTADYRENTSGVTADLADSSANTALAAGDIFISIENLFGGIGADQLFGDDIRNVLRGGDGNDLLDGRGGVDRLIGGGQDDIYVVDDARDATVEIVGGGVDLVRARASVTLQAEIENLTLIGNGGIDGTGNALRNAIAGNGGANVIDGGLGNDVLTGGGGADQFWFTTALGSTNQDIVDDLAVGTDKLALSRAIFTELNGGSALAAGRFVIGSTGAQDALDRIIYDPASGGLFYDADGNGAAAQILFAGLDTGLALTAADFVIIG